MMAYFALVPGSAGWSMLILLLTVGWIVFSIAKLKLHPFIALITAAMLAGIMAHKLPSEGGDPNHLVQGVQLTLQEFGLYAGGIGFVIAMASIIGTCMMDSGAADKIVRRIMGILGEKRAPVALMASGFFLSIPVFFDTMFYLLIPLARALSMRLGRDYTLYVLAICCGGVITHSLVAPTPGPILVVEQLGIELGPSILVGIAAGILPAFGALWLAKRMNDRVPIPIRETPGATLDELNAIMKKPDNELPSFFASILPIVVPVLLLSLASLYSMAEGMAEAGNTGLQSALGGRSFDGINYFIQFAGEKNIAMLTGAVIALLLLIRQRTNSGQATDLGKVIGPPLEVAGVIILITAAGGAFGKMINHAGVAEAIQHWAEGRSVNFVLLAWVATALVRVAQGSATVSMGVGAGLMAGVISSGVDIGCHPMYIFLAVGFGSIFLSWMNDSGFWIVGRLSGFTQKETLKTWTVLLSAISLIGLIETLIFSAIFPFAP